MNNYVGAVAYPGEEKHPDVHDWEKSTHGVSAAEVAAVLLEHWRFSPESIESVRGHHQPESATSHEAGAARLHLSCGLLVEWGFALPGESGGWRTDEEMLARAGVRADQVTAAVEQARAKFAVCAQIEWSAAA